MTHTHVSLFCGCGGFAGGLKAAGWDTLLAVDLDRVCLASHRLNHPEAATLQADLGLADAGHLATMLWEQEIVCRPVTLVTMGPPCKPFSRANRRKDPRSGVLCPLFRLLAHNRPRAVVVENAAPMARPGNGAFRLRRDVLRGLGYRVSRKVLRASSRRTRHYQGRRMG
jgi:DNA (cytosine-5)-methyltransferase 1